MELVKHFHPVGAPPIMHPNDQPQTCQAIDLSHFPGFPEFFAAYIEAALWSSDDEDSGESLDRNYGAGDIDPDSFATLQAHALSFYLQANYCVNGEESQGWSQAGHDFWLTQNRHGCGFWDGDWPTYGDRLTSLSHCYPGLFLQVDEGVIYVYPA